MTLGVVRVADENVIIERCAILQRKFPKGQGWRSDHVNSEVSVKWCFWISVMQSESPEASLSVYKP